MTPGSAFRTHIQLEFQLNAIGLRQIQGGLFVAEKSHRTSYLSGSCDVSNFYIASSLVTASAWSPLGG